MECADFLEFQERLRKTRDLDDKITYALNNIVPTESFKKNIDPTQTCKELYLKIENNYSNRETSIRNCISETKTKVRELKTQHEKDPDSLGVIKQLRKEESKVRVLQTELNVEEVVKGRTLKLFYERCRSYYKPANLSL